jgi:hypothetical protein
MQSGRREIAMARDRANGRRPKSRELRRFLQELYDQEEHKRCYSAFSSLTECGKCDATELMWLVATVKVAFQHHSRIQDEPYRMNAKKLNTLVEKTFWVAREWEKQYLTEFGKEVLRFAESLDLPKCEGEFRRLPQRLALLASETKRIHSGTRSQRRPIYDDALAMLTEYVCFRTGNYHDPEVASLVWWAIEMENYDENTLRVWRKQHKTALERARAKLSQD